MEQESLSYSRGRDGILLELLKFNIRRKLALILVPICGAKESLYYNPEYNFQLGDGRVWRRCHVSYVTGASNGYWLTAGQCLLSL